jgi:hypothetical protein
MYRRICGSFKSAKNNWVRKSQILKSQKYMFRKSQIRKLLHLRKVRRYLTKIKVHKFADLRFAELIFGPSTFAKSA